VSTAVSSDDVGMHSDARAGARAMLPILVAYAPLGLVVGGQVAASDNPFAAWLGTWLIYGGAAQLAVLDVLAQSSACW
jgi:predicted branched-subunit amino acid permease